MPVEMGNSGIQDIEGGMAPRTQDTSNYPRMFDNTCTLVPKPLENMKHFFHNITTLFLTNRKIRSTQ